MVTLYLCIKVWFALNCVFQFAVLMWFLGLEHVGWGATLLSDLIQGKEWPETGHFPRVTLCDYEVVMFGSGQAKGQSVYR